MSVWWEAEALFFHLTFQGSLYCRIHGFPIHKSHDHFGIICDTDLIHRFLSSLAILSLPLAYLTYVLFSMYVGMFLGFWLFFRDNRFLVKYLIRVLFFATPIIWMPLDNKFLVMMAKLNLFTASQLVSRPLYNNSVPYFSYVICLAVVLVPCNPRSFTKEKN